VIPDADRMLEILGKEDAIILAGPDLGIEEPLIANQTSFKEDAVFALFLLDVKPALFFCTIRVGPKNRFQRKCSRAGDGVRVHQQRIAYTVEHCALAAGSIDDPRVADDTHRVATDLFQIVYLPGNWFNWGTLLHLTIAGQGDEKRQDKTVEHDELPLFSLGLCPLAPPSVCIFNLLVPLALEQAAFVSALVWIEPA